MTVRGFVFLLLVGVAASVASGLVVEQFTAPGLQRTLAFAAPVALALYLAGWWGERRGWIGGHAQLGRRTDGFGPARPQASATSGSAPEPTTQAFAPSERTTSAFPSDRPARPTGEPK